MQKLKKLLNNIQTKRGLYIYGVLTIFFLIWMLFLDTHSWRIHSELNEQIETLEKEKKALEEMIANDQKTLEMLENKDSMERFARESYGHKKENETVFIITTEESAKK
ncbi:MAG: FtsB family cell division protein [Flavobacteriaceae bacterium]